MTQKKEEELSQKPPKKETKEEILHLRPTKPGQKPVRIGKRDIKSESGKER